MKSFFDEEALAAYALDQLDTSQHAAVSEFVESNAAARETVGTYRQLARLAKTAMKSAPQLELDELRRKRILQQAKEPGRKRFTLKRVGAVAAAAVLLVVGAAILVPNATQHKAASSTGEPQTRLAVEGGFNGVYGAKGVEKAPELGRQLESLGYATGSVADRPDRGGTGADVQGVDVNGAIRGIASSSPQPDRYLIKTAFVSIETDDARKAAADFRAQAAALGGFVGNLDEVTDGLERHTVILEVRVPADKLDGALQALDAFGKVLNRQVNAQDVTKEYVDNESRIRNLSKTEERLLDHLSKTSMIENTLKIETELNRVREQLELIQGRQRVLSHRVAFSSITATFTEAPKAESVVPAQSFSIGKVSTEAVRSLVGFGRVLITKLIWVGVWLPVWAPILLVGWLIWRRFTKA